MDPLTRRIPEAAAVLLMLFLIVSCGGSSSGSNNADSSSNQARFTFNCDLNGLNAVLDIEIEAVGTSGVVWGGGPNPQITAVIGSGGVNYFTAGTLQSPTASYVFTGTNQYADFTDLASAVTFRVEWVINAGGLTMIISPFGPGPTFHTCAETSADYI